MVVKRNVERPGYKTTEFWLAAIAAVVGAVLASGVVTSGPWMQGLGVVAAVLSSMGYGASRGLAKAGEALGTPSSEVLAATERLDRLAEVAERYREGA